MMSALSTMLLQSSVGWATSVAISALAVLACAARPCVALPPGRAWTPIESLYPTGYRYLAGARLEADAAGLPELHSVARGANETSGVFGFRWADSTWVERWRDDRATGPLWPVSAPAGRRFLVYSTFDTYYRNFFLCLAEDMGDRTGRADTVARLVQLQYEYSAAVSGRWRWAAVNDNYQTTHKLRLFASQDAGPWLEIESGGQANQGVAMAVVDDSTALVAWEPSDGIRGVRWGYLRGATWEPAAERLAPTEWCNRPQFRRHPSGGYWLAWDTYEAIALARFENGAWTDVGRFTCKHPEGYQEYSYAGVEMSRDPSEFPAFAWFAQTVHGRYFLCASFPSDSEVTTAEELPFGSTAFTWTVGRDANDEIWIAWWNYQPGGTTDWVHTYSPATVTRVRASGSGRSRTVSWDLSESAPRTWWAVLRSDGTGPFERVARIRSTPALTMSWVDTAPPRGRVHYRIRRESVDKRYEWLSEVVRWPAHTREPLVIRTSAHPSDGLIEVEVLNAEAGPLRVDVYDLQGRLLLRQEHDASGGYDRVSLDVRGAGVAAAPGVYLLRVRDAAGQAAPALKIAVVH
jgi:hypothetical protein